MAGLIRKGEGIMPQEHEPEREPREEDQGQPTSSSGAARAGHSRTAGRRKTDAWLRAMMEHATSVFSVVDADGVTLYASPSVERAYGWKPEVLIGRDVFEHVHPDDVALARERFGELLQQPGETRTVEVRYRHKNESWLSLDVSGINRLHDPDVGAVLLASRDVTDRRQAAAALRQREQKYRGIIENLHDTYFRVDLDDNILMASRSGEQIFGFAVEEVVGRNLREFYVDLNDREEILNILARDGFFREFEAKLRRKDGSIIWVSSNGSFWLDADGNVGGVEGITRDISDRKEFEEKLREAQKMEAVGTLAGGIAHDFNNLLTGILGCASVLKHKEVSPEVLSDSIGTIERASIRAAELVEQLLGFARKGKLRETSVNMHEMGG